VSCAFEIGRCSPRILQALVGDLGRGEQLLSGDEPTACLRASFLQLCQLAKTFQVAQSACGPRHEARVRGT